MLKLVFHAVFCLPLVVFFLTFVCLSLKHFKTGSPFMWHAKKLRNFEVSGFSDGLATHTYAAPVAEENAAFIVLLHS